MKMRILGSLLAVTFVFGAMNSADAGLFGCKKKRRCCNVERVECAPVAHAPRCAPVKCEPVHCAPAPSCCAPKPSCCAPGHSSGYSASAPATSAKGAPKATDAPPAPPSSKKEAPKPKTE